MRVPERVLEKGTVSVLEHLKLPVEVDAIQIPCESGLW